MPTGHKPAPSAVTREIAAIFDRELQRAGRTQSDLAEAVGVSQSQLSKIFRGHKAIDMDLLYLISADLRLRALDVIAEAQEVTATRERLRRSQKA